MKLVFKKGKTRVVIVFNTAKQSNKEDEKVSWREAGAVSEWGGQKGVWGPSETEADSHSQDSGHHRAELRGLMWLPGPPATGRTWFCASDQWQAPNLLSPEGAVPASSPSHGAEHVPVLLPTSFTSSLSEVTFLCSPTSWHTPFPLCLSSSCPLSLHAPYSRHPQVPQTSPHAHGQLTPNTMKNVWRPSEAATEQVRVGTDQGRTGEGMQVRLYI